MILVTRRYSMKKDLGDVLLTMVMNTVGKRYKKYFYDFYNRYQQDGELTGSDLVEVGSKFILDHSLRSMRRKPTQRYSSATRGGRNKAVEQAFLTTMIRLFERMGYRVVKTKGSHDYGADLVLKRYGRKSAVQVKCWRRAVGIKAVQEVVAARTYWRCHDALVVATSVFTKPAKELARSNVVELWDGAKLSELMRYY